MALQRTCHHHPDRLAIGVCVITHKPMCAECSTRYDGVNYSREGLAILEARRAATARRRPLHQHLLAWAGLLATPLWTWLLYVFCRWSLGLLIDLEQQLMG